MYVLFLTDDNLIRGYKETTQEETETFKLKFILVDELPAVIRNQKQNTLLRWVDGQVIEVNSPSAVSPQDAKLAELNVACNAAILAGFTSNALGSPHTYDFDYDAQINLGGMLNAITAGIVTGAIVWKASGLPESHTVAQFKTVFADGLAHKNALIGHFWTLKAAVLAAQSTEEIDAIVW
ncbi:hypothetical protein LOZ80_14865 [Paenibacillus sp. HWE-109]|uniref:DUF4376 domain-containing protein n=1 Tax=Paenibacillus sp. HWE-109 TaxID=1306526 RepID=UPI001EDD0C64|nr:hypothetical protein [Paenibacillus sp. HWE-109]UKS30142.1 hypothetical protein LOZ80_14865 [Paenibacillus sp. HWE-109]